MWRRYYFLIIFTLALKYSLQDCPQEVSTKGLSVTWPESSDGRNIESVPPCHYKTKVIRRHCNNSEWIPSLDEVQPCLKVMDYFNLTSCPPGFHKISETNSEYCYQISGSSAWNYPCFRSGGASIITDLNTDEINYLLESLNTTTTSRYFWLPAQRQKLLNPVVWYIPGPNWGRPLDDVTNGLLTQTSIFKNCLLLDIESRVITTDVCTKEYPNLCFYLNDLHYPAKCPKGYHAFRFMTDNGTCFGIEQSDTDEGMIFEDFLKHKCSNPMGDSKYNDLTRFIFKKIAILNELPNDAWCWFAASAFSAYGSSIGSQQVKNENEVSVSELVFAKLEGIINNNGSLSMMSTLSSLPCMACETEMLYGETVLDLEFDTINMKLYLTVYFPSGLWKYDNDDRGIQCFSDARGFMSVIDVNDQPYIEIDNFQQTQNVESVNTEKTVYAVNLVTDRSAQYWCEGHTKNFSLVTTSKIVANPQGDKLHVFALVVNVTLCTKEENVNISNIIPEITAILCAEEMLLMEIFEYTSDYMIVLLHLHVSISEVHGNEADNLLETYTNLKERAVLELPKYNASFINISSSIYCFPTTSVDAITLDWELTLIGHIAAPRQFCLQNNGLPVKRQCHGSYHLGGTWGDVEGHCDQNYKPSATTSFLYNFVKGQTPENFTSRFLTDGLSFVLGDVDIIIPADIYYLSMSLQQVVNIAQQNESSIDMGELENIAWAMDRVMVLDGEYLRLSQTLNSTNVILDSVNDIIEMLSKHDVDENSILQNEIYQLAVKPQFVVQISFPKFNNISGIAVVKVTNNENFTDMLIQPLYKNTTIDAVLSIQNLEIAAWVPENVLNTLKKDTNESVEDSTNEEHIRIVINIFHNDAVFQQLDTSTNSINSRIVGISIPGYITNLKHYIPILFKELEHTTSSKFCGYWDFDVLRTGNNPGFWSKRGCFYVKTVNNVTVCECYHMTHFGQLIDIGGILYPQDKSHNEKHLKALNIITLVGSFLSLMGVAGIWITALVFQAWRKKAGTKVLLQLSTAIALPLIFILVFNLDNSIFVIIEGKYAVGEGMENLCIVLGALLHYSILSSFMWMLITAILQFIRYVRVLGVCRPSRFMVKFTLIGWGIPIIPVIIVLVVDNENYIPDSPSRICYPNGIYFILCVLTPIFIIIIINTILFILVIIAISRGPDGKMRTTDIDLVGAQLRLSVFLFFLLGLSWLFGIFSFSSNMLWSYLFCLTSTLQGFVLFIYFVICDPTTRNLWITLMKPQFPSVSVSLSSRDSVTSLSSS